MTCISPEAADPYAALLPEVIALAQSSGARIRELFTPGARILDRTTLLAAYERVEAVSAEGLREALALLRPGARWLDDDPESHRSTETRAGEWWVVDGVEGAVNFIHGVPEFSVNITLLLDNLPVLAVVHQPVEDHTYSAVHGHGATLNGKPVAGSDKTDLAMSIVTTSQAGGTADLNRRTAAAINTMFDHALAVRQTVPSTFPLLAVAAGHHDLFWRFGPDLPAVAPGALIAAQAGATVTDLHGNPWTAGSTDIVVAPPALHPTALALLRDPQAALDA
ncbi:inositol monophosphatase family protein [Streptomyces sp. NPDC088725]|uniref:inositol monophosphatase family protein n=1 Tax=Streptomyces sp. NPDC088725 TaxID=3365873 RepID=UPI003827F1C1